MWFICNACQSRYYPNKGFPVDSERGRFKCCDVHGFVSDKQHQTNHVGVPFVQFVPGDVVYFVRDLLSLQHNISNSKLAFQNSVVKPKDMMIKILNVPPYQLSR